MEKVCEFCTVVQPVIYCTADAAFLCLSCDAKVHSANAVSYRHFRALLCEACRNQPSYVRCLQHRMVLCHACEQALHGVVSHQHETRTISSYAGCPSAKHFAKLWGFDVNELDNVPVVDQISCSTCVSEDNFAGNMTGMGFSSSVIGTFPLGSPTSATSVSAESFAGSSSRWRKVTIKNRPHKKTPIIMQQILELRRLQLTEGSSMSSVILRDGKRDIDTSTHDTSEKLEELTDHWSDDLPGPVIDLEKADSPDRDLNGDPFWQCRSPSENSQFWSQNLQELGVCEEFDGFDDFNMPDMDGSFCDFEDLFGAADQDVSSTLLDEMDASWSSIEKDVSADMADNSCARAKEIQKPTALGKHPHPSDETHISSSSIDSLLQIHHSCSASFSDSCLSAGITSRCYLDSKRSGITIRGEPSYACGDSKSNSSISRRCKGRRTARSHNKQGQLAPHKDKSETHKRGKSD